MDIFYPLLAYALSFKHFNKSYHFFHAPYILNDTYLNPSLLIDIPVTHPFSFNYGLIASSNCFFRQRILANRRTIAENFQTNVS